jgi:hypothetical protein
MCIEELRVPSEPLLDTFESLIDRFVTDSKPITQQGVLFVGAI